MFLLWHEALGSDDEQAAEDELCARVLYHLKDCEDGEQLLQSLHLVQGLLTFVRMLRRRGDDDSESKSTPEWTPQWTSVSLSRRRYFVLEVEPQIFMALGVQPRVETNDHKSGYEALLREMYDMFRLFHGSIDSNLRLLPPITAGKGETTSVRATEFTDGMDLLMGIAAARKRLRKLRLVIDSYDHNQSVNEKHDRNVVAELEESKLAAEAALESLAAQSPASILQRKCARFFPILLQALDARGSSGLSELQGLGYFPMDQPTFLALQTFVNGFHAELMYSDDSTGAERVASSALFFRGNLLWSSMEMATMQLLYKFLRLREERGMTMMRSDETIHESDEPFSDLTATRNAQPELWMANAYEDTFRPVWSSKLSYGECDVVSHTDEAPPYLRESVRSLHKQHPVSLSTFLSEAQPSFGNSNLLSPSASGTRFLGSWSNGASLVSLFSAMKTRARSISFRNAGLLLKDGHFSKFLHANREIASESTRGETEVVWSPQIFLPLGGRVSTPLMTSETTARHRVVVWHEADLTMVILIRLNPGLEAINAPAATLEQLKNYLEGQQRFQNLAQLILTSYNAAFAPEKSVPNLHSFPAFLYINRVNLAFRMQYVPRLLKSKEDDLFPIPAKLLAHYFPSSLQKLINELHAELHKSTSAGNREICVRTRHAGWVLAKKSETSHRELYVFFDSKIASVYDLSDSLQMLLHDQFGNVLF
ncbi:Fungal hypothetical protein [Phytophthora infestans]|uniref:CCZ1/INTU/HPS4 third Longin domain-containing protein n=1 Tax=Phytophthora infestans TaxID=4787 RepID=A0A833SJI3_PHYIN|nr:Fungal hypothetical protein [Phytophthora infestans]KAF4145545.1 Fungal hypothetical protein [Phytophthora infestans]